MGVVVAEVSVETISSQCSSVAVPHSVVAAIEVITDPDEVKMLAMNFALLLKIFIMERQRNWLFKDKLFVKSVQERAFKFEFKEWVQWFNRFNLNAENVVVREKHGQQRINV